MDKKWKHISWEQCDECGDAVEVFTDSTEADLVYDGEDVRCVGCSLKGGTTVDEDGRAWVSWEERDDG